MDAALTPAEKALAAQPRLSTYQVMRLKGLLVCYMKSRFFSGLCPYDSNTVGIANAFSESLPKFPNSVPDWPDNDKAAQKAMFDQSVEALR